MPGGGQSLPCPEQTCGHRLQVQPGGEGADSARQRGSRQAPLPGGRLPAGKFLGWDAPVQAGCNPKGPRSWRRCPSQGLGTQKLTTSSVRERGAWVTPPPCQPAGPFRAAKLQGVAAGGRSGPGSPAVPASSPGETGGRLPGWQSPGSPLAPGPPLASSSTRHFTPRLARNQRQVGMATRRLHRSR